MLFTGSATPLPCSVPSGYSFGETSAVMDEWFEIPNIVPEDRAIPIVLSQQILDIIDNFGDPSWTWKEDASPHDSSGRFSYTYSTQNHGVGFDICVHIVPFSGRPWVEGRKGHKKTLASVVETPNVVNWDQKRMIVSSLSLPEKYRGQDLANKVLAKLEAKARVLGCSQICGGPLLRMGVHPTEVGPPGSFESTLLKRDWVAVTPFLLGKVLD